jgi:site-specific recombinase XerD
VGGGMGLWVSVATEKNAKIAEVHSIPSLFGHKDLFKTKLFMQVHEKSMEKVF